MHIRVRSCGGSAPGEAVVALPSRLSRVDALRPLVADKFGVPRDEQRLFYGGKLLEDGYTLHDYGVRLNDVVQLMPVAPRPLSAAEEAKADGGDDAEVKEQKLEETTSRFYRIGDLVDVRDPEEGCWLEGKIVNILKKTSSEIVQNGHHHSSESKSESTNLQPKGTKRKSSLSNPKGSPLKPKESPSKLKSKKCKVSPSKHNGSSLEPEESPSKHNGSLLEPEESPSKLNGSSSEPKESPEQNVSLSESDKSKLNKSLSKSKKSPSNRKSTESKGKSSRRISDYFGKKETRPPIEEATKEKNVDESIEKQSYDESSLIFRVQLYDDELKMEYKFADVRPRARTELDVDELQSGITVMVNYNVEEPEAIGYWYDFTIDEVNKLRKNCELTGTLHRGNDSKINGLKFKNQEKIFVIEDAVPLERRSKDCEKMMTTETTRRNRKVTCTTCKDLPDAKCKDCGCSVCAGKNRPNEIILCDECNLGFHLTCLNPPLSQLPDDDWYCNNCRRDDEVIAPGKAKQQHKVNKSKTKKDWGRGMACVGKTQTSTMPANHFGPIPGIEVGMCWRFRIQLSESGVHRPPVSGIHGRDVDGAYSIVLSGGYEDDTDDGFEFTYTGSGGRDLSGNRRTADQSSDQTLTRENRALAKSCACKVICEEGADAGENWKDGKPVRVVRSYKMMKHFPEFAPKEGIRYDGIYKVVKYYPEVGKSGFRVWKYMLRRDDPNPAPWEKNAKRYAIVYPDGYLEAEAEKQALKDKQKQNGKKNKKRVLRESNGDCEPHSDDDTKNKKSTSKEKSDSPPRKKIKTRSSIETVSPKPDSNKKNVKVTPQSKSKAKSAVKDSPSQKVNPFSLAASKKNSPKSAPNENSEPLLFSLSSEEREAIDKDELNKKLWSECIDAAKSEGKQGFINKVTALFLCIICQEVAANPVTSSCGHNFCINCLKLAFKSTNAKQCPYCRAQLSQDELQINESLKNALRTIMPGYDGKIK